MTIERQRLMGLQDRSLELKGGKSTPTTDADIGSKARAFMRLVDSAVVPTMALEGMRGGRASQEMIDEQHAQLGAIRGQAAREGIGMEAFNLRVKMKIDEIKAQTERERRKAEEKAGDYKLLRGEFPGVFPDDEFGDSERQAFMGDVPPVRDIVNFGNHAKPADAGGFEPARRGW